MVLSTAIDLLEKGVTSSNDPQRWADLGAGDGLFTRAVSSLVAPESTIYVVDKNKKALDSITLPNKTVSLNKIVSDFEKLSDFEGLDGIIMANALHYVEEQTQFLTRLKSMIKPSGRLIIIEYDTSRSNPWVPYPILYAELQRKIRDAGFLSISKIGETPSRFQGKIYSALIM